MALIDTAPPAAPPSRGRPAGPREHRYGRRAGRTTVPHTRPPRPRPGRAALRHRGTGVRMSRSPHRRRPVNAVVTAALALTAGLITMWLGLVAQLGGVATGTGGPMPDRLGVVRVQAGESLQSLAARVAPGAPPGQVAERIRELNGLDSVVLEIGQTLIAPIG